MTMLSRVLGLVRDIVIATLAGATANADAFFIAFKIPQFLRRLFAEGAFAQAFVPVLSEFQATRSFADVKNLVDRVAGVLGLSVLSISVVAVIGAPVVAMIFAPGFVSDPAKYDLTVQLIRIMFPYLFFISLTGFAGAVLNSYGRFAVPAFTPVLLNASLITAALWGVQFFSDPVFALAWGVFVAGAAQFLFQLPFLAQLQLLPRPKVDTKDEGVRRIMTLMIPALFGVSVSQINLLLDTVLASFLPTGSVSWLYYSDRLVELPLGVFAIAVSTVILPSLSRKHAGKSSDAFAKTLDWAMRMVLLISLPAALALFMLAEPILVTLFQYGALDQRDVAMAALSLKAYSIGLLPFMLIKILAPGFYAQQDIKTPVKIGIIAMVANMGFNIAFVLPLHFHYQIGHVGLALATAASAYLNAGLLFNGLKKQGVYQVQAGFWLVVGRYIAAMFVLAGVLFYLQLPLTQWIEWGWQQRVWHIGERVLAGAGVYLLVLLVLGLRPKHLRIGA
ncbi:MAG: murein biosynthesis integral membrane protein MurJ [Pseudomonadales bacterium]|nr:murein biosynthesis integral membrane protein MurJ [Pseudomonadales bacterium]